MIYPKPPPKKFKSMLHIGTFSAFLQTPDLNPVFGKCHHSSRTANSEDSRFSNILRPPPPQDAVFKGGEARKAVSQNIGKSRIF